MEIKKQIGISIFLGFIFGGLLVYVLCFIGNILSYERFYKECEKMWAACKSVSSYYAKQDKSSDVPENVVEQLDVIYQMAIEKATNICNMSKGIDKKVQLEFLKEHALSYTQFHEKYPEFYEKYPEYSVVSYLKGLYNTLYCFGRIMAGAPGNDYNYKRNTEISNNVVLLFYLKELIDGLENRLDPETGMYT